MPQALAFSPDGQRILSSTDRSLKIFKMQSGNESPTLESELPPVNALLFDPEGRRLMTGANDQAVKVLDTESWREVLSLVGHESALAALAFSPDGLHLATADSEGRVIVRPAFPWRMDAYPGDDTMAIDDRIAPYRDARWDRRFAAVSALPPIAGARRSFDRPAWSPGVPVRVSLDLEWSADASSLSVREVVPVGWGIQEVSHDGRSEGQTIVWDVASWASPGLTLHYTTTPPAGQANTPVLFSGALVRSNTNHWFHIEDTSFPRARTLVFQNGAHPGPAYQGAQDSHIIVFWPDNNTGSSRILEEGAWTGQRGGDHKKILVQFDLSSMPTTFPLGRAELRLFAFSERLGGLKTTHTLYAARIRKPWAEGESTQKSPGAIGSGEHDGELAKPGAVTFTSLRYGEQTWEKPGVLGLTDVADAESSVTAGTDWPQWVVFDVTESVRLFFREPSENHGWKISQDPVRGVNDRQIEYVNGIFGYKSSEADEVHLRPMLVLVPADIL
jgi:hypothetical protein